MTLDQRVEQLERRCRQLRRVLIAMTVAIAAVVLVGAAPKPAEGALQTRSLEVVDGDGNVRIRLGPADEGYGLVVYDRDGRFQATLTDAPLGAVLSVRKSGGSISLMALEDGCGMTMRDRGGKPRALVLLQEDAPEIMLKDQEGKTVFSAPQ